MKLGELATRLGAELRGDAELEITGVKGLEEAGPTEITFVANPRYAGLARTTKAAAVIALTSGWADHYSAAAVYLRLNGLVPPTAKPKE